ncbi:hypothetical protein KC352_g60 [Hortaea werneckii]|nr:hypothetical protein KC352_g60 [Hortaea werneckii]
MQPTGIMGGVELLEATWQYVVSRSPRFDYAVWQVWRNLPNHPEILSLNLPPDPLEIPSNPGGVLGMVRREEAVLPYGGGSDPMEIDEFPLGYSNGGGTLRLILANYRLGRERAPPSDRYRVQGLKVHEQFDKNACVKPSMCILPAMLRCRPFMNSKQVRMAQLACILYCDMSGKWGFGKFQVETPHGDYRGYTIAVTKSRSGHGTQQNAKDSIDRSVFQRRIKTHSSTHHFNFGPRLRRAITPQTWEA